MSLSEVLISTLVMSIGVVALASLFPISVLRSIQASQLTNAANLRYNAEAYVRTVPELLSIGQQWQPATSYNLGDAVVPLVNTRLAGSRPAVYICTQAGMSGGTEPRWIGTEGGATNDNAGGGNVTWATISLSQPFAKGFVIDPLGFMIVDPSDADPRFRGNGMTGARQHFGNIGGNPYVPILSINGNSIPIVTNRFPAFGLYQPLGSATLNEYRAAVATVLPDSWTLQAESTDLANYNSGSSGAGSIDMIGSDAGNLPTSITIAVPDLVPDRVVLLDESGRRSHTRQIAVQPTAIGNGARISWAAGQPLPAGFAPSKARVESLERRYTYLLSVRQSAGRPAHIDVVVGFRRSFSIPDERVYSCVFRRIDWGADGQPGNASVDDNGNGTVDDVLEIGWANTDDKPRNWAIVQYDVNGDKPFFKKGGFVCDAINLRWYRIIDVYEPVITNSIAAATPNGYMTDPVGSDPVTGNQNNRFVRLTLDQNVVDDWPTLPVLSGLPLQTTVGSGTVIHGAILMRGVVDVFPLRPRPPSEE